MSLFLLFTIYSRFLSEKLKFYEYLQQFDSRESGKTDNSSGFREDLVQYMDKIQSELNEMFEAYNMCLNYYKNSMQKSLTVSESHVDENELLKLHQDVEDETMTKV